MENEERPRGPSAGRAFRPRRIALANGEALVLRRDGSIDHLDTAGATARTWALGDPEWSKEALRFGLQASSSTVTPSGRGIPGRRPPRP